MPDALTADQLYHACDADAFAFATTTELEPLRVPLGQDRALEAIEFGVEIERDGFNLFVIGAPGFGRHRTIEQVLSRREAPRAPLYDWCYVNNFDNLQKPRLLRLPPGLGKQLCNDMRQLVEDLLTAIPSAFQSEDYQRRRQQIGEDSQKQFEKKFKALHEEAHERGVAVVRSPSGYTMAPIADDKIVSPEDFEKFDEEKKAQIQATITEIQQKLQDIIREIPLAGREAVHRLKALNREVTELTVHQFIAGMEKQYADFPEVIDYLKAAKQNAIDNAADFLPESDGDGVEAEQVERRAREFHIYQVNVLVDNTEHNQTPVVFEDHPTFQNLVGRVEHVAQMGTLLTDFTLIKPGALHRANGGYLVLEADKVLTNMYAWEGLKRSLQSRQVTITTLEQALSLASTLSLEPEAMPLDVKVILTGEAPLYYLMKHYDHELDKLFKVVADFSYSTDRDDASSLLFARMIATEQQSESLRPLDRAAVARVIDAAARRAGDSSKLSLETEFVGDVLKEADYWAGKAGSDLLQAEHVEQALEKRRYRLDRIREQLHEQITRGINLVDTDGAVTGQVNGLTVIAFAGHAFGSPARITATARLGSGKVVDIEREVELGGEIHSKGVLILGAYLANRYAHDSPLPLQASLVFEQSYGGVDGDSATAAELCALLSAIAGIPLKQNIAVTGSMNQQGTIQAIGGVNEKIEGFFDICNARGLSGDQGVVIPASNQVHLMLRRDIRDAVAAGQFHVYTARRVDDVMEVLSGLSMGAADADGNYPPESVNGRVIGRIAELQGLYRKYAAAARGEEGGERGQDHG